MEDRIRAAKDTGLRNRPFHAAAQNRIWLELCALATDAIASAQRLALTGWAAVAEPKRLRLRLFTVAGHLIRTVRRRILKIPDRTYTLRGTSYLLHRMGWSPQVTAHRAVERDEDAIAEWRTQTWAKLRG